MSNGSRRSLEESRPRQARRDSQGACFWFACGFAILGGCHQATLYQKPDLQAELATIASQDLFLLAVSHAQSGDLLRAEQYLSAARHRGYNESAVTYWLVRVCVVASRYQSALGHAADYLREHPADWSLRLVVASIHEALGDVARAKSELKRVIIAQPARPLPHYRLAMLYRDQEADHERARAHLEAYLRLTPEGPHAAEVRSALSEVIDVSTGPRLVLHPGPIDAETREVP